MTKWDYHDKKRGNSFQYETFLPAFKQLESVDVRFCDTSHLYSKKVKSKLEMELRSQIKELKPHHVWFTLSLANDISHELLLELKENPDISTLNWYADDSWRFEDFTQKTFHLFNYAITTDAGALAKYQQCGFQNVIKTQWAAAFLRPVAGNSECLNNVSFIGQPHTDRREIVQFLLDKGIDVKTYGYGWNSNFVTYNWNRIRKRLDLPLPAFSLGRVSQQEMHRIIHSSKINLHFSKNSAGSYAIHARTFEITGLGGFLLSEYVEGLEEYFEIGEEIEVFRSNDELADKIKFYLKNESMRQDIAKKGYERVKKEHTYKHRLKKILEQIRIK